jgi:hypothetical protein
MILGRAKELWAGLLTALLNLVGAGIILASGLPLDAATVAVFAAVDGVVLAVLGILANQNATGTAFGRGTYLTRTRRNR